jgi:hypothetical protein
MKKVGRSKKGGLGVKGQAPAEPAAISGFMAVFFRFYTQPPKPKPPQPVHLEAKEHVTQPLVCHKRGSCR